LPTNGHPFDTGKIADDGLRGTVTVRVLDGYTGRDADSFKYAHRILFRIKLYRRGKPLA
jgi:hypothetical protein